MELETGIYSIRACWTTNTGEVMVDYLEEYIKNMADLKLTIKRIENYRATGAVAGTLKVTHRYLRPLHTQTSDYLE